MEQVVVAVPRVLGGFAVIPTGSTLMRDVETPSVRAALICACRRAIDALEAGLVDARDGTAVQLNAAGFDYSTIAGMFRVPAVKAGQRLAYQPTPRTLARAVSRREVGLRLAADREPRGPRVSVRVTTDACRGRALRGPDSEARSPRPNGVLEEPSRAA